MRPLLLASLLVVGCQTSDAPVSDPAEPSADATEDTTAAVDETLPAGLSGLNLQANHASGSVLRVTGVQFANDHIAVDVEFTNGTEFEQKLNSYSDNRFILRDNLGNVYRISPPPNNGDVAVPAGQNIAGAFVFLGRINPDATGLSLVTNDDYGSDSESARNPKMTIQIPFAS